MSAPKFGYGGEERPQKRRATIKRDSGGNERWADAILPADAEAGTIETPTNRRPLMIIAGLIAVSAAILSFQLFNLQIANGARNLGLADGNRLREKVTRAPRGVIYDRHKNILAQNLASFDVTVIPSLLPQDEAHRQQLYANVGQLLNLPQAEVVAKVEGDCIASEMANKSTKERATADCLHATQPRLVATNVDRSTALSFDQSSTTVPGFSLDVNPIRQYSDLSTLSAVLGYTGRVSAPDLDKHPDYSPTDFIGKLGIEEQYETLLKGQNGSEQTEVDASGRPIKLLASKPAEAGANLVLSVDTELQKYLQGAVERQMQASGATQASAVALNPKTGEILATVNLPGYDNNLFAKGISQNDYTKLVKNPAQPLFNKAVSGGYPTGSIIKPLIGSAALQEGAINANTTVNDTGSIVVQNKYDPSISYTYRSYERGGLGVVNIVKAMAVSSDVFFFTVGGGFGNIAGLGVDKLTDYYHKFGLGKSAQVDLPDQTAGRVPTPDWKKKVSGESWTLGDTYNISIGQGDLLASPLQMAVAEAAIANGGKIMQPHFLKEVQNASGQTIKTQEPKVLNQNFISQANLDIIRSGMRAAVTQPYGTAHSLDSAVPVPVAAKTGTAETVVTDTGAAGQSKPNAWFTAFAPYDDPQIEIVVLIQNAGEGGTYGARAVRETLAWCFTRPGGCVQ